MPALLYLRGFAAASVHLSQYRRTAGRWVTLPDCRPGSSPSRLASPMSAIPLTFYCQIRIWLHHAFRNIRRLAELLYLPLEVAPILPPHPPIPDLRHIS